MTCASFNETSAFISAWLNRTTSHQDLLINLSALSCILKAMQKGSLVKRKHSPQKDTVSSSSSSNDEEIVTATRMKNKNKHSSKGKKPKERTSPPTSESEDKVCVGQSGDGASNTPRKHEKENRKQDVVDSGREDMKLESNTSSVKDKEIPGPSNARKQEENEQNVINTERSDKQLVTSIEEKMNISSGRKVPGKPKKSTYLFDFLGDEVSNDESQALQALSSFWVSSIARNKNVMKRLPPKDKEEQDFYNKYCDKHGKLSIIAATRIMSLPYVITLCLKTTPQIEVVVSDRVKALEESEELRQEHFEVVEAMAMHLM